MMIEAVKKLIYVSPYFFPLYLIRFQVVGIPFTALELFTYVLFVLWYIERIRDRKIFVWDPRVREYFYAGLLLFIGASLGAIFIHPFIQLPDGVWVDAQQIALGVWKGWILAPLLYFIVLVQVFKTPLQVRTLLRQFVYSAVLVALVSYGYGFLGDGITYDFRLRGFFDSANYLALYIAPAFLLTVYFVTTRESQNKKQNYMDLASLIILAHALLFSQSYAAILGIFGALAFYILRHYHCSNLKRVFAALLVLGGALLLILSTQIYTGKFQRFLDFKNRSSTSVRVEIYQVSANLLQKHPLLGIGLGQFQNQYQTNAVRVLGHSPLEWNMPHPHNIFLAFWMNAGLAGLIALLLLIALMHQSFTYPLIAMWGILLHGFFDTPFWKNDLAMIFWLLAAAIVILQSPAHSSAQKPAHTKK
ncbi:O-antigen ligase family protein [Candidatus Peregrinibacteria bacterium]|nr:O-antigen ligase family protein [Candidatus Peregrinibacteria bacterium]